MNLVLSPHYDDAALSLGGLLAQSGKESVVATFFTGSPTPPISTHWVRRCGFKDSAESMRARKIENEEALRLLGVAHIRDYSYLEKEFRASDGDIIDRIAGDIESLVAEFPGARLYAPLLDKHRDHEVVAYAAMVAAKKMGAPLFSYQDMPYIFDASVPTAAGSAIAIPLEPGDMQKKLEAIACYVSQVPYLGKDLLARAEGYAKDQARTLGLTAPFCEVVYATELKSA